MSTPRKSKSPRSARILSAARNLLEQHGYEGVTMRALAEASSVSVPTLYNLFGGREPLLLAAVEERFSAVLSSETAGEVQGVEQVLALFAGMNDQLFEAPRYGRTMVQVFVASSQSRDTSLRMARALGERLTRLLYALKTSGVLAPWVEPLPLATRLSSHYLASVIAWATTRMSESTLRAITEYELCLSLVGIAAKKRDRELLHSRAQTAQTEVARHALSLGASKKKTKEASL